jgi:hypothetical protein
MSSNESWPALVLQPEPSRFLAGLLVCVHLAALLSLVAMGFPWWVSTPGGLVLAINLPRTLRRTVFYGGGRGLRGARWNPDGSWTVWDGEGRVREATLGAGSMATRLVSVLNFKRSGFRTDSLVLLRDALDAETMRRLVARFRLSGRHDP